MKLDRKRIILNILIYAVIAFVLGYIAYVFSII